MNNIQDEQFLNELVKIGFLTKFRNLNKIQAWLFKKGIDFTLTDNGFNIKTPKSIMPIVSLQIDEKKREQKLSLKLFFTKEVIKALNLEYKYLWLKELKNMPQNEEELLVAWQKSFFERLNQEKVKELITYLKTQNEKNYLVNALDSPIHSINQEKKTKKQKI